MPSDFGGPKLPRTLLDRIESKSTRPSGRTRSQPLNPRAIHGKKERLQGRQPRQYTSRDIKTKQRSASIQDEVFHGLSDREVDTASISVTEFSTQRVSDKHERRKIEGLEHDVNPRNAQAERSPAFSKALPASRNAARKNTEDQEIAALEKKLGIKDKKRLTQSYDDGLDNLLDGIDSSNESNNESKRKRPEDVKWLKNKRQKFEDESNEAEFTTNPSTLSHSHGASHVLERSPSTGQSIPGDKTTDLKNNKSAGAKRDGLQDVDRARPIRTPRENPYIAPTLDNETSLSKYLPPNLRWSTGNDDELERRIKRQLQGLVNRISESNLISIVVDINRITETNPRQYVIGNLIDLLLVLVADRTALNDTFIILHAGFVAALSRSLGQDFGAHFLERAVAELDSSLKIALLEDKVAANLVSFLSHLFNLSVIGSDLIFDLMMELLQSVSEYNTELLLRIIRASGHKLRQDDAPSLSNIVLQLQKTTSQASKELSVRTLFMIDTINELKNNKLKAGAASSALSLEHLTGMRKLLGTLASRTSVRATEPMHINLADLRDGEKRGRWWLVGANWKGRDTREQSKTESISLNTDFAGAENQKSQDTGLHSTTPDQLANVAKQNGMTTPVRRAIFVALLLAADYIDAHVRITKLTLSRAQEVEIPRVLLHCVSRETVYNPYYALVAQRLCHTNTKLRKAFAFSAGGLIGRMQVDSDLSDWSAEDQGGNEAVSLESVIQWAKFYAALVRSGEVGLNILKSVQLDGKLGGKQQVFAEVLLVSILTAKPRHEEHKLPTTITLADPDAPAKRQLLPDGTAGSLRTIFSQVAGLAEFGSALKVFLHRTVAESDIARKPREKARLAKGLQVALAALK